MQSVVENEGPEEVCIVLSDTNLEREIIITVATQSDTATGKDMHTFVGSWKYIKPTSP